MILKTTKPYNCNSKNPHVSVSPAIFDAKNNNKVVADVGTVHVDMHNVKKFVFNLYRMVFFSQTLPEEHNLANANETN